MKRDGGEKAVSVEMEILDLTKLNLVTKKFAMRAVTIIGVEPAIPDAKLTVLASLKIRRIITKRLNLMVKKHIKLICPKNQRTWKIVI